MQHRFVAHLMVHRRTQTRVAVALAGAITLGVFTVARTMTPAATAPTTAACSPDSASHADIPTDWRVVALPRDVIVPRMVPGDRVDVVTQAQVIAGDAVVVAAPTESDGLVVAVPPGAAAAVATSAQNGDVSVVGHG